MGLVAAVNKALDSGINLTDPQFYADITEDKLNRFLMGEDGVPCALVGERVRCLREVADVLKSKFSGSVTAMIKRAARSFTAALVTGAPCAVDGRAQPMKINYLLPPALEICLAATRTVAAATPATTAAAGTRDGRKG